MIKSKFFILAAIFIALASNAEARNHTVTRVATDNQATTSGTDATAYSATDSQLQYNDKNLANYQDPYLTNPRGYRSNQYGEAAPAPKPNVFYSGRVYHYEQPAVDARTGEYIER